MLDWVYFCLFVSSYLFYFHFGLLVTEFKSWPHFGFSAHWLVVSSFYSSSNWICSLILPLFSLKFVGFCFLLGIHSCHESSCFLVFFKRGFWNDGILCICILYLSTIPKKKEKKNAVFLGYPNPYLILIFFLGTFEDKIWNFISFHFIFSIP